MRAFGVVSRESPSAGTCLNRPQGHSLAENCATVQPTVDGDPMLPKFSLPQLSDKGRAGGRSNPSCSAPCFLFCVVGSGLAKSPTPNQVAPATLGTSEGSLKTILSWGASCTMPAALAIEKRLLLVLVKMNVWRAGLMHCESNLNCRPCKESSLGKVARVSSTYSSQGEKAPGTLSP